MKILLCSPVLSQGGRFYFPSGLAMISSVLKQAGHDVHCLNLDLADDWEREFSETFARMEPLVVGCGGMTPSFGMVRRLFELAKQMDPGVVTVAGGGLIGSEPKVLSAMEADIGVLGEGERTVVELMDRLRSGGDLLDVQGLLLKNRDGSLLTTPPRPYITDLDSLPLADYRGFHFGECLRRNPFQTISTSRGCPYHCTFCYCIMGRGKYRFNSIDHVIEEISYLKNEFAITEIGLIDEIFALKRERILEFCEKVKPLGLIWSTQVRVEVVDRELLDTMRDSGCYLLFYGLESMSPLILESMRKRLKPEQVAHALELTHQSGIKIFGNFIFGDPAETADTAWETLDWWYSHRKYLINLGKIDCWPGTAIYRQALEKGVIADPVGYVRDGCPLVNLTEMDDADWKAMLRRIWAAHEALIFPGRLLSLDSGPGDAQAVCVCPHCGKDGRISGLHTVQDHPDRGAQRVACPACHHDFDMPLRIPPRQLPAEMEDLFQKAFQAFSDRSAGDRHRAIAALTILHPFWAMGWQHPLAAYLAALCHYMLGEPVNAGEDARHGLRYHPTAPYLLEMMAVCYRAMDDHRMSALFHQQALLIAKAREAVVTPDTIEALDPMEARFRKLFRSGAVPVGACVAWD